MADPTSRHPTIGERVKHLRLARDPQMTQRELAERAGVSVALIAKLESGAKQHALIPTLHRIAEVLDVDVAALLARPARVDVTEDDDQGVGVLQVRRTILAPIPDVAPMPLGRLERGVTNAWHLYWSAHYDQLAQVLPRLVGDGRMLARDQPGPAVSAALSDAYCLAGSMLTLLGHLDLGYMTMERAGAAAQGTSDPLRASALQGCLSWVLVHHTGSFDVSHAIAVAAADQARPLGPKPAPAALGVWSALLVAGAVAAAREGQQERADELLAEAQAIAARLDEAGPGWREALPPILGQGGIAGGTMPNVVMQQVDASVVTGRAGRALEAARRMPPDHGLRPAAAARHRADIAYAHTLQGRDQQAVEVLLGIERATPDWMRFQPYPRVIVRELLERERRVRTPRLRSLAERLGVA